MMQRRRSRPPSALTPQQKELHDQFTSRANGVAENLLPAVTPVLVPNKARDLDVLGSGVLVRVGPTAFMITAAHVMERARGQLHIAGQSEVVHVSGRYHHTLPARDGENDRFDLAIVPLAERELVHLRDARFLALSEMELATPRRLEWPHHALMLMIGYPVTRQERTIDDIVHTPPLYYTAMECSASEYSRLKWSHQDHVLLGYDKKDVRNAAGALMTAPDPYGMSGGGVFRVVDSHRLVGICIEYLGRQERTVVATRLKHVAQGIRSRYAHLAPYLPVEHH